MNKYGLLIAESTMLLCLAGCFVAERTHKYDSTKDVPSELVLGIDLPQGNDLRLNTHSEKDYYSFKLTMRITAESLDSFVRDRSDGVFEEVGSGREIRIATKDVNENTISQTWRYNGSALSLEIEGERIRY